MVSYYHWLQDESFDHPAVDLAKTTGFSGFLNATLTAVSFRNSPYASYLTDGAGTVHADLFIRLEHFEQDSAPLRDHLGFDITLPVANQSQRPRDWRGFYTEYDAERLAALCAKDIAAFGYTFDPQ